ncbi:phage baseplate assembly protein V [Rahnella aquatilis]|uniref:phage baseplate assembly protein V n=1 Tax=Rahnella aquatilis TaxID=34038 RepID=UPI00365A7B94
MWNNIDARINRALSGIRRAFRGVLTRVNSAGPVQTVQVNGVAGEQLQDAELYQNFGFTSVPPAGSKAIILPLGGQTSHSIIIATEHTAYRIKALKSGEVSIYSDEGAHITIKKGRIVDVECDTYQVRCKNYNVTAEEKANFDTPMVNATHQVTAQEKLTGNGGMAIQGGTGASFNGNVSQTGGNYTTDGDVKAGAIGLKTHHHPGDSGGSTGPSLP